MNLSPEEKQVGKDNFNEATGTTRRDFLKGGIAATVAAGTAGALGGYYFKYTKVDDPLRVRFETLAGKRYVFTLSEQVPGGVVGIRSQVDAAGAPPLLVEEMTLEGVARQP